MNMFKGIVQDGQVKLSPPANLPNGTEVTVLSNGMPTTLGTPDDQWPTDPDGIAKMLTRVQRVEPFDMTPAEKAEIEAWRQKVKQHSLANQESAINGLFE